MNGPSTTYGAKGKPFAWSYSKIKNYRACPKKHFHVDVAKDYKEDESEILTWGNEVHAALAKRLKDKTGLPATMVQWEKLAAGIEKMPGTLYVEQKYGLKADYTGCEFFGDGVWYRGIADVVAINDVRGMAVDWKLGKIIEDSMQLALMAACLFGHFPQLQQVDTVFFWLKDDAVTHQVFTRPDMISVWGAILPEVAQLQEAYRTMTFPPKPGGLCRKWCPVRSCPYNGVGG